jgi:hypothetical protein
VKTATSILTVALFAAASAATAQTPEVPPDLGLGGLFLGSGGGDFRAGYHASTAFEGASRGIADAIRSQGQFNLDTAEAAVAAAQARQQEIDNYQQRADAYYNVRRKVREYRAAERRPRPTAEDLIRYARRARPERLSPMELDTLTGQLVWPVLLWHDAFAEHRAALEEIFEKRALEQRLRTDDYLAAKQSIAALKSELKTRIRELPLDDYASAKRFLRSLDYEAQLPHGPSTRLAANVLSDDPPLPRVVP